MKDKMNRSMVAETPVEKEIENFLNQANNIKELVNFAEKLKSDLKELEMPFYSYRVKNIHSAIRTFRIAKYTKLEDLQDLFGILVVVEKEKDIKKVVKIIKSKLKEKYLEYNLVREKEWLEQKESIRAEEYKTTEGYQRILADLKRVFSDTENLEKTLPPFSYIILGNITVGNTTVPVEFRIQSKAGFQIVESAYFTVYKNDQIDPKIKAPLLFILHQLINRKIKLDTKKGLKSEEKKQLIKEMEELYEYNIESLTQNKELVFDVWREYAKISAKYKLKLPIYDFHFFGVKGRSKKEIELIEEYLDRTFEQYKKFDLIEIDTKSYIKNVVNDLKMESLV